MDELQTLVDEIMKNMSKMIPDMQKTLGAQMAHRRARKLSLVLAGQMKEFRFLSRKVDKEVRKNNKEKKANDKK